MPIPTLAWRGANNGKVAGGVGLGGEGLGGPLKAKGHTPRAVTLAPPCSQSWMTPIFSSEAPKRVVGAGRVVYSDPMLHPMGSSNIQASCPQTWIFLHQEFARLVRLGAGREFLVW